MSRIALTLVAALAPLAASAQFASRAQVEAISAVAECLAVGLPEKWKVLHVAVILPEPMAAAGSVRYQVTLPDDRIIPLEPCDPHLPPSKLLGLRATQNETERAWTTLLLTMKPDASFDLKYEYKMR